MHTDSNPTSPNWAAVLRDLVNRAFDTSEMHELAFDFKLDFDDIPGRGKSDKIVELLQILARRKQIPEFIERCQALRPRENWQTLLAAAQSEPLSFHIEPEPVGATAVSTPSPPPTLASSLLQNKTVLIGLAALALIVVVALVALNRRGSASNFNGDEALLAKIETLVSGTDPQNQLFFDAGLPGWQTTGSQFFVSGETVQPGAQSTLVRDKTFQPGQGILIDFQLSEASSSEPPVTFSLQNAPNQADATRIINLRALTRPESAAIEAGEAVGADKFALNTTLVANESYTVVMGFDENGRFLASLFGFSTNVQDDANFVHIEPAEWASETWWFHIDTGPQGHIILLGGWEFNFDAVR